VGVAALTLRLACLSLKMMISAALILAVTAINRFMIRVRIWRRKIIQAMAVQMKRQHLPLRLNQIQLNEAQQLIRRQAICRCLVLALTLLLPTLLLLERLLTRHIQTLRQLLTLTKRLVLGLIRRRLNRPAF
jgi:hypothetical protein